jgi:hypothetical protein
VDADGGWVEIENFCRVTEAVAVAVNQQHRGTLLR